MRQEGARRLRGDLRGLARAELLAMHAAAEQATACLAAMAGRGVNPVTQAIGGAAVVREWAHFPPGDVIDPATRSRYYYHAHCASERAPGEHGHFHTFARADGGQGAFAHLAGISTDASGGLLRLFTTNRWVTDERWLDAGAVCRLLGDFDTGSAAPACELHRWVPAVLRMFRPQIAHLLQARDAAVSALRAADPGQDALENRALAVTSEMPVDFLAQIRAIENALADSETPA
jgi:hypothetical protein